MPLDPYLADRLHLLEGLQFTDLGDPTLMARSVRFHADDVTWDPPADVAIHDDTASHDGHAVPVRVYKPQREPIAALLWLHGGGFVGGSLDMPESHVVAAELAHRASALVVAVDYRLASEDVRFPLPVDDVITAWQWLASRTAADSPISIGGASAGAAIAMSAVLRLRDIDSRPASAMLLAYPFVHFPTPAIDFELAAQMASFPPLVRFTADSIAGMVQGYVGRISNIPAHAMPGAAPLTTLPTTTIVLSEYDDLRPSGELLTRQLAESGVSHNAYLAEGMLHGHLNRLPGLPEVERSLEVLAQALRSTGR